MLEEELIIIYKYAIEKKGSKCKNHHKKLFVYYYKHFILLLNEYAGVKNKYAIENKGNKCNNHHKKLIVYYYKHFKLFSKIGGFISFQKQIKKKQKHINHQCTT